MTMCVCVWGGVGGGGGGGGWSSYLNQKIIIFLLKLGSHQQQRRKHKIPYAYKPSKMEVEQKGLFFSVLSPFYRVCMGFHASVSIASVNQALER